MPLVRKPGGGTPPPAAPTSSILADLASSSEETRWSAARAAAQSSDYVLPLAEALRKEPAARVREAMLTSLARIGSADSVAAVIPLLRSDDASLRAGALDALHLMIRGHRELLLPLLQDADTDVRILSCELARTLPSEDATAILCQLLQSEDNANVCAAAVDVLAETGQLEALPVLVRCAVKFSTTPFLVFAIQIATDRITAQASSPRA